MDTAHISTLLEPFLETPLPQPQLEQISTYIDLLKRWNARISLTAIKNEEEIVTRHFGESLFLARHIFPTALCHPERSRAESATISPAKSKACPELAEGTPNTLSLPVPAQGVLTTPSATQVLDIGSGAGFPALPIKIWAPQIHLTLIESNHKKAVFLREVARALTLTNINVIADRAEVVAARQHPQVEVVTLRAVESFTSILSQAATFLAPNGTLALLIGSAQLSHLTKLTTLNWLAPIPIPQSHTRVLSIGVRQRSGK